MQPIAEGVFIETAYTGVTLGVIFQPQGAVLIDTPLRADDARAWRAAHVGLCPSAERLMVSLDAHYDRTLGVRAMELTFAAHDQVAQAFRNRPTTFKGQPVNSGSEWETLAGLGNIRWSAPEICFSHQMDIDWGRSKVTLLHRPGHAPGAIWAILPEEKVIFAGDSLLPNQAPFLAQADLPVWIEELETLLAPVYADYTLVSGRSGVADPAALEWQIRYLREIDARMDELAESKAEPEAASTLIPALLEWVDGDSTRHEQYAQRLRWGLPRYYTRHYQDGHTEEDES